MELACAIGRDSWNQDRISPPVPAWNRIDAKFAALVKATVQNFLDEVISELAKGNRLEFRDFGVFETRIRAARTAQNPKTLEQVQVPAKRVVKFKMGRLMKQKLNG